MSLSGEFYGDPYDPNFGKSANHTQPYRPIGSQFSAAPAGGGAAQNAAGTAARVGAAAATGGASEIPQYIGLGLQALSQFFSGGYGRKIRKEGHGMLRNMTGKDVIDVNRSISLARGMGLKDDARIADQADEQFGWDQGRSRGYAMNRRLDREMGFMGDLMKMNEIEKARRDLAIGSQFANYGG